MFKISRISLFLINLLLMAVSWRAWKVPQGDEYLFILMISVVFVLAPHFISLDVLGVLLSMNLAFLIFYLSIGSLNPVDVFVLITVFAGISYVSYSVKQIYFKTKEYQKREVGIYRKKYNSLVKSLEITDRRGKKIENELSRISRLYEVTTKLTPALTFKELMDHLFEFLEGNMTFSKVHLFIFKDGELTDAITRSVAPSGVKDEEDNLNYSEAVSYSSGRGFKPSFVEVEKNIDLFQRLNVDSDTYMQFPLFMGDRVCAIIAIEGATRQSYGRINILASHIALEIRKVELYEKVQQLSITDGLTEVYLRRYLTKRLSEEIDRSRRLNLSFSIGMVDVDHFKECNDTHGHLVGDVVLSKIAERLKASVREVDLIARYGGEEFCILLPETNKALAMSVSERLREAISAHPINAYGEKISTTVSVGIATFPEDSKNLKSLLEMSDMALYKAKRSGRNMVCSA